MADKKLNRYLEQAKKAYQKNDRQTGAQLIDKILQKDFNHPGAWQLLFELYSKEQNLEGFRFTFAQKHYPNQIHLLQKIPEAATIRTQKTSILSRLLRIFNPKIGQTDQTSDQQRLFASNDVIRKSNQENISQKLDTQELKQPQTLSSPRTGLLKETQALETTLKNQIIEQEKSPSSTTSNNSQLSHNPSGGKYRILVVDDNAETQENIIRSLLFNDTMDVVGTASNGQQAIELAKKLRPEVILMDVNMPDMDGIHATASIRREVPTSQVIILTVQDDLDYMRNAMLAGARDFLTKPPMIDELSAAVQRAAIFARQELEKIEHIETNQENGSSPARRNLGKIITVYSPRGGAGCTTITANLASVLHKEDTPVVIIDANLQFGDIPVVFNAQGNHSLSDLVSHPDELEPDLLKETLIHHSSGIDILSATNPEEADLINAEQFQRLIQYLSRLYAYVLIDCPSHLADTTLAALESSDLSILLITQDIPAIARAKKFLDLAPLIHLDSKRILVAVNKYDKRIEITPEKLAETLKNDIKAVIPLSSETVITSINRGVPFMLQKQMMAQPIGHAILELVQAVRQQVSTLNQEAEQVKPKS